MADPMPAQLADDCPDLGPSYTVKNRWSTGMQVEVSFATWDAGRTVYIDFPSTSVSVNNPLNADFEQFIPGAEGHTTAQFILGFEKPKPHCVPQGTDEFGAQRELCEQLPQATFSFQFGPPTAQAPRIVCHEPWPAPPPPPPPPPPPSGRPHPPPPPPPPPFLAVAAPSCALGGVASVARVLVPYTRLEVSVRPKQWRDGYVIVVRFDGSDIKVSRVSDARLLHERGAGGENDFQFVLAAAPDAFLGAPPPEHFDFRVDGDSVELVGLSCYPRTGVPPPPPPPPPPALPPPPAPPPAPPSDADGATLALLGGALELDAVRALAQPPRELAFDRLLHRRRARRAARRRADPAAAAAGRRGRVARRVTAATGGAAAALCLLAETALDGRDLLGAALQDRLLLGVRREQPVVLEL